MPPIRSISCDKNSLIVVDGKSTHTFDVSKIPIGKDTIPKLESYINSIWIPSLQLDYEMEVHVLSVSPLVLNVYTANKGEKIPTEWWIESIE